MNLHKFTQIFSEFTWIYLNLSEFTGIYLSCLNLPEFTWIFLNIPEFTWIYLNLPEFTWIYMNLLKYTWNNLNLPEFTWIYLYSPELTWIDLNLLEFPWFTILVHLGSLGFLTEKRINFVYLKILSEVICNQFNAMLWTVKFIEISVNLVQCCTCLVKCLVL